MFNPDSDVWENHWIFIGVPTFTGKGGDNASENDEYHFSKIFHFYINKNYKSISTSYPCDSSVSLHN
jgi:hypothetical protein